MSTIQALPDGIIIDVLKCGVLDCCDIQKFALTCVKFSQLASLNSVWKQLFLNNWSFLIKDNGRFKELNEKSDNELYIHEEEVVLCRWKVLFTRVYHIFDCLNKVYHFCFHEESWDNEVLASFFKLTRKYTFEFVLSALHDVISTKNQSVSLTLKYYAQKVYNILHQEWLKPQVFKLLHLKDQQKSDQLSPLIKGAVLIENWFNPLQTFSFCQIEEFINATSQQLIQVWENFKDEASVSDSAQKSNLKHKVLNELFFNKLRFCGNQGDYFNVNNSYIHQVLKTRHGIPILLSVIYREIGKKIGFNLECVNNPGHFVLRWQVEELDSSTKPTIADLERAFCYIDVFNNGRLMAYNELNGSLLRIEKATLNEVLHRISLNIDAHSRISDPTCGIEHSLSALKLCLLLEPDNYKTRTKRLNINLSYNINHSTCVEDNEAIPAHVRPMLSLRSTESISKLIEENKKKREKERSSYTPNVSLRSSEQNASVTYAVGMVMKHRRYDYICVIRGWDCFCSMPISWVRQMGVDNLERGVNQPFYHVLVDKDGSQRYAADDSLEMVYHEEELDHPEIGRYFSSTSRHPARHYIPNDELDVCYPEDRQFVAGQLAANYSSDNAHMS